MNVYTTDRIRNVVLLGHGGCGKTSLVEAMAYLAGLTTRMGTVADKNTISDFDKEETKRQFSIHTSVVAIPWKDSKINVLDTPGYFDFVGEVEEAVSAADAAIIVISGKAGIETGTRRAWEICEKNHLPRMIFVTDMDIDNASYRQVVEDLQALYGKKIAPFHLPVREDGQFVGYVNVIQQKAKRWIDEGTVEKFEVPEYSQKNLNLCREALLEAVAETSEEFMDRYFNGDEFSEDEIRQALRVNVMDGSIVPVLMGSNPLARGMYTLMADIVKYFPSPDKRTCAGINTTNNEVYPADYDFAKPKSAYIFKTIVDPYIGKYSLIKVNSGVLKTDDVLFNYHRDFIFDMDGTILDSMPYWRNVSKEYAMQYVDKLPDDFDERTYVMDLDECSAYSRDELGISTDAATMRQTAVDIMTRHYSTDIPAKDGMLELIRREHEAGSCMCIFTSSDRGCVDAALNRLGITDCFNNIFTVYDIPYNKKNPESYKLIAEKMHFKPEDTWVYEDVLHGIESARQGGFKICAVYDEDSKKHWNEICAFADEIRDIRND